MTPRKKIDLAEYKALLEGQYRDSKSKLKQLEDRAAGRLPMEGDDEPTGHEDDPSDLASGSLEKERELAEAETLRDNLEMIDLALERLEAGTFGTCAMCAEDIDPARLEAIPYALYCFKCQSKLEMG
jgi:RNA polymerase-binding transcription factor DksA